MVKVGLAQFHSPDLNGAVEHVRQLLEEGAELVVLPEKWMNGGEGNHVGEEHPFLEDISELSRTYGSAVLTGALIESAEGAKYITCYAFGPDGRMVAKCRKLHPFGLEKKSIRPGSTISHFDFRGIRIGVAICYDMDFPETARALALAGCDMVAVPTKIRKEGIDPWLIYLQARTLENRMPVVFANEVSPPHFLGRSGVIDLVKSEDGMMMFPRLRLMDSLPGRQLFEIDPSAYREDRKSRMSDRNSQTDALAFER